MNFLDLPLLLRCIAQVETGGDDTAVGPKGELSQYQIKPDTWYQHAPTLNFFLACNGIRATTIAQKHLLWLDAHIPRLTALETECREYVLAWAWKEGRDGWVKHDRLPWKTRVAANNYATRVSNLYYELTRARPQPSP